MKCLSQHTLSSHLLKAVIVSLAVLVLPEALDGRSCCDLKWLLYVTKRRASFSERKPWFQCLRIVALFWPVVFRTKTILSVSAKPSPLVVKVDGCVFLKHWRKSLFSLTSIYFFVISTLWAARYNGCSLKALKVVLSMACENEKGKMFRVTNVFWFWVSLVILRFKLRIKMNLVPLYYLHSLHRKIMNK